MTAMDGVERVFIVTAIAGLFVMLGAIIWMMLS